MESTASPTNPTTPNGATADPSALRRAALLVAITALAVVLSLIAITPRVVFWKDYPAVTFETARVTSLVAQLDDPVGWEWKLITLSGFGDNALRWRLLPPAVGHALHLPARVYLGLPWLGLFALIGTCLHYYRTRGGSAPGMLALGVLVGTSAAFFGSSTSIGYFDCLYLLALVIFTFSPSPLVAIAACAVGPWCDEKFLLMLPACACIRWSHTPALSWVRGAAISVVVYGGVRLLATAGGDASLVRQIALCGSTFASYWSALPEGWWYGFRLGWLLVAAGGFLVWQRLPRPLGLAFTASLAAGVGAIGFLAWDSTRSIAMVLPVLLAGAYEVRYQRWTIGLAAVNPFLPAAYLCCATPIIVPLTSFLRL